MWPGAKAVYSEHFEKSVRNAVEPVLAGAGYSLVELSMGRRKGSTRIAVVIYRKEGVGVDDCASLSGMLLPRLGTVPELQDVSLEVSSPGTERSLRSPSEYAIFAGRGVRILANDETEWRFGIIDRVEEGTLWLRRGKEKAGFALAGIRRARLDHSVEVEEKKDAV